MDTDALRSFLVDAHRNGYATGSPDAETARAGTVIEYRDRPWEYVDRYHGVRSFLGHEVVLRDDSQVWGMHYDGAPASDGVDHESVYAFLREALARVTPESPYRGPERVEDGAFVYRNDVDGTLDRFRGVETIERDGAVLYRGRYGGGLVE